MAEIAVIISSLYAPGGEERVVSLMANEWVKRHDITIYTFEDREAEGNKNDYILSEKIRVERVYHTGEHLFHKLVKMLYFQTGLGKGKISRWLLKRAFYPKALLKEWIQRLNQEQYDIVIGISGVNAMLLGYIKDQITAKTISWEHSSYEGYFDEQKGYYRNRKTLYKESVSKLDATVVLNEDIQKKYQKNIQMEPKVIYNPKSFSSNKKADFSRHHMVTCGRLELEKGYDDLIEAFAVFHKRYEDWTLTIIGGGSLKEKLQNQIKQLGLDGYIQITGYIHEVGKELQKGSIFIMTSRWEGFPMSVTEALEMGLPIISYDLPAMLPLVSDGREGMIVPSFQQSKLVEAMENLAEDQNLRKRMAEHAIRKAETLCPQVIAEKWFELFEELLAAKGKNE